MTKDMHGSNELIKNGEKSVRTFDEVLAYIKKLKNLEIEKNSINIPSNLVDVFSAISPNGSTIEDIMIKSKLNISDVSYKITFLEMYGLVEKDISEKFYRKI